MPALPSAEIDQFEEAIKWFRSRLPKLSKKKLAALLKRLNDESTQWADKAQLDVVSEVWLALDKAIANGETLETFKKRIAPAVEKAWGGTPKAEPYRIENIFRTNVQRAYMAGHVAMLKDPDVLEDRPFWRFSAVLDGATSEICRKCTGTILPASSVWWKTHQPPLHFQCRSTIISMRADAAKKRGITKSAPRTKAEAGFGSVESPPEFTPTGFEYPNPLVKAWRKKT